MTFRKREVNINPNCPFKYFQLFQRHIDVHISFQHKIQEQCCVAGLVALALGTKAFFAPKEKAQSREKKMREGE